MIIKWIRFTGLRLSLLLVQGSLLHGDPCPALRPEPGSRPMSCSGSRLRTPYSLLVLLRGWQCGKEKEMEKNPSRNCSAQGQMSKGFPQYFLSYIPISFLSTKVIRFAQHLASKRWQHCSGKQSPSKVASSQKWGYLAWFCLVAWLRICSGPM